MNARGFFVLAKAAAEEVARCQRWLDAHRIAAEGVSATDYSRYQPHGGPSDSMTKVDELLVREAEMRKARMEPAEATLDLAFDVVGIVSQEFSDLAAQSISSHYLFGDTWASVAACAGVSDETVRVAVKAAMCYLDSTYEFYREKDGRVRVRTTGDSVNAI